MADRSRESLDEQFARTDATIARVQQRLPVHQPAANDETPAAFLSRCPLCGTELEAGSVTVHGTLWGFLLVGLSYEHCWFQPASGAEETVVLSSKDSRDACRCLQCGFVAIKAAKP